MRKIPGTLHRIEIRSARDAMKHLVIYYRQELVFESTSIPEQDLVNQIITVLTNAQVTIPKNRVEAVVKQELNENLAEKEGSFMEGTVTQLVESMQGKPGENLQKIILMGLGNSGKTCIYERVFEGKQAWELIHSVVTKGISYRQYCMGSICSPMVWDLGGQAQYREEYHSTLKNQIFTKAAVLLFIIDVSDMQRLDEALKEFQWAAENITAANPKAHIYIFFHKIDLIIDKAAIITHLKAKIASVWKQPVKTYVTSVFNESLFHAWSDIIQSISPRSSFIRTLLYQLKKEPRIKDALILEKENGLAVGSTMNEEDEALYVGMLSLLIKTIDRVTKELQLNTFLEFTLRAINNIILFADITQDVSLIVILDRNELSGEEKIRIDNSCKIVAQQIKNNMEQNS